jgi:hypothetical protein
MTLPNCVVSDRFKSDVFCLFRITSDVTITTNKMATIISKTTQITVRLPVRRVKLKNTRDQ